MEIGEKLHIGSLLIFAYGKCRVQSSGKSYNNIIFPILTYETPKEHAEN